MIELAVNADDFGFTRDVNAGIVEAHRRGILTSTTLMANGAAFDDAVRLAGENPALDVGCHLVLIGGDSLTAGPLPRTVGAFVQALALNRIEMEREFSAQVEKILAAGIQPTHLDTHKHTHLAPPVMRAVVAIARRFGIPWVRRPFGPLASLRIPQGVRMTDRFAGFPLTGKLQTPQLVDALRKLRPGFTEFMCHPGHAGEELRSAQTRLKDSRARELEALTSIEVRRVVEERGIALRGFK